MAQCGRLRQHADAYVRFNHAAHRFETAHLNPQMQPLAVFSHDAIQKMLQRAVLMQADMRKSERL